MLGFLWRLVGPPDAPGAETPQTDAERAILAMSDRSARQPDVSRADATVRLDALRQSVDRLSRRADTLMAASTNGHRNGSGALSPAKGDS